MYYGFHAKFITQPDDPTGKLFGKALQIEFSGCADSPESSQAFLETIAALTGSTKVEIDINVPKVTAGFRVLLTPELKKKIFFPAAVPTPAPVEPRYNEGQDER